MEDDFGLRDPFTVIMEMKRMGCEFEVVDIPKTERKFNENGEYIRENKIR